MEGNEPAGQEHREYSAAELQYVFQVYQERYDTLSEEIKELLVVVEGLNAATTALSGSADVKKKDSLMNVGGGLFVGARIDSMDNVVVNIGAGLAVGKSVDDAGKMLKKRLDRYDEAVKKLVKERKQIEELLTDISYKMGELVG